MRILKTLVEKGFPVYSTGIPKFVNTVDSDFSTATNWLIDLSGLPNIQVEVSEKHSACVVMASKGVDAVWILELMRFK